MSVPTFAHESTSHGATGIDQVRTTKGPELDDFDGFPPIDDGEDGAGNDDYVLVYDLAEDRGPVYRCYDRDEVAELIKVMRLPMVKSKDEARNVQMAPARPDEFVVETYPETNSAPQNQVIRAGVRPTCTFTLHDVPRTDQYGDQHAACVAAGPGCFATIKEAATIAWEWTHGGLPRGWVTIPCEDDDEPHITFVPAGATLQTLELLESGVHRPEWDAARPKRRVYGVTELRRTLATATSGDMFRSRAGDQVSVHHVPGMGWGVLRWDATLDLVFQPDATGQAQEEWAPSLTRNQRIPVREFCTPMPGNLGHYDVEIVDGTFVIMDDGWLFPTPQATWNAVWQQFAWRKDPANWVAD